MTKATSDLQVERVFRAGLSQLGSAVGCADDPTTGAEKKRWVEVERVDRVAETIIDEYGGPEGAKVLWKGKIIGVERTLRMGYIYGELIIGWAIVGDEESSAEDEFRGKIKIPFKNEKYLCCQNDRRRR
ncbi:hypothetical protein GE09DRAFT_1224720 [Coniochaeta sp. 2T2.1]|nr:hypothetical protein GE09DRAFT_1224720 [Coniochaeta sp. 2T2.1]